MREESEIVRKAVSLKCSLVNRRTRLGEKMQQVTHAKIDGGMKPERLQTLEDEIEMMLNKQDTESMQYAVLRWALGYTEQVEPHNLELDK